MAGCEATLSMVHHWSAPLCASGIQSWSSDCKFGSEMGSQDPGISVSSCRPFRYWYLSTASLKQLQVCLTTNNCARQVYAEKNYQKGLHLRPDLIKGLSFPR